MSLLQPSHQLQKGCFVIANPEIESDLFFRGVLLLCEHNETGSFALLVNKPLDFELPEEIVNLTTSSNKNVGLRAGGPVQTNQMMLLHNISSGEQQLLPVGDEILLGGDLAFLHELLEDESSPNVLLCFGYAGWANGQLDREFLEGSWYACPASGKYLFHTPPEKLWETLLNDMGGRFRTISSIPEDPFLN